MICIFCYYTTTLTHTGSETTTTQLKYIRYVENYDKIAIWTKLRKQLYTRASFTNAIQYCFIADVCVMLNTYRHVVLRFGYSKTSFMSDLIRCERSGNPTKLGKHLTLILDWYIEI